MAQAAQIAGIDDTFEPGFTPPQPPPRPAGKRGQNPESEIEVPTKEFFSMLASLTDTQWQQHIIYIWRLDPFYDNTNGGKDPKYIAVETRAITEENLKEEHGSGTYKLWLNNGANKRVALATISISDPHYPPHMPPGDWLNHPRNKKWASWKPLIDKWWTDKVKQETGQTNAAPSTDVPQYMVQFMNEVRAELNRRAPDMGAGQKDQLMGSIVTILPALLQQQNNASDPSKMIEVLVKAREMISPPAAAKDDSMMTFVLAQLTRLQESNDKLMGLLLTQKAGESKQPDPLSQVETMGKLITLVSGIVQPAQPKEWYQELAESVAPKLVDLGTQLVSLQNRTPPAPRVVPPNAMPVNSQPASYQNPPPPQVNAPPPAALHNSVPEPEMDTMQKTIIVNLAIEVSQALNLQMKGDHYAEQFCFKHGEAMYEQLTSVPPETLLPTLKAIPEAWQYLAPYENLLPNFIELFYAFGGEEDDNDPNSISAPAEAPAPVKAPKKKAKSS